MQLKLTLDVPKRNSQYKHPCQPSSIAVYVRGDAIKGKVGIEIAQPIEHRGVTVRLVGYYEMSSEFPQLPPFFSKELKALPAGVLPKSIRFPFSFEKVAVPTGSYCSPTVTVGYKIECAVSMPGIASDVRTEKKFFVVVPQAIEKKPFVKAIGIENVLHLDLAFESLVVDPRVGFTGCLYFELSKLRILSAHLHVIREETVEGVKHETKMQKFEILDGAPVRGTVVPIRFFTGDLDLWPSPRDIGVSVDYTLQMIAVDEVGEIYIRNLPVQFVFAK